jgi:hypothetical protein
MRVTLLLKMLALLLAGPLVFQAPGCAPPNFANALREAIFVNALLGFPTTGTGSVIVTQ